MASRLEFVKYVTEQLQGAGEIRYRSMFGEYGIYCYGTFVAMVCDDQLFVKITEEGRRVWPGLPEVPPYEGAKPCFLVEDVYNREHLEKLLQATWKALPQPKSKKNAREEGMKREGMKKENGKKENGKGENGKRENGKLDYKKEYRDLYLPKKEPMVIEVPEMLFIMVDGRGDPNTSPDYESAMEILYGLSYSIKMSKMNGTQPEGYFEYVVPPLEGLWWSDSMEFSGWNGTDKSQFCWTSMIRQPEFVTEAVFERAKEALLKKKPGLDLSRARLVRYREGLCCQVMHTGPYDEEPKTLLLLERFMGKAGYVSDFSDTRKHHEIYLGDPRKTAPERLKTVLRHPVRKK